MGERASNPDARQERPSVGACVLLAGAIKPSPLVEAAGFSTLDFLIGPDTTLLDEWGMRLIEMGIEGSRVMAVHGANVPSPTATPGTIAMRIRRERDHLRGPAGAARDAAAEIEGHEALLIAEAKRHPGMTLAPLFRAWHETDADIVVARNPSGAPAGLYITRTELLELVPKRGFMDLKEQWLGKAAAGGARVLVVDLPEPGTMPVRILPQYLRVALGTGGFESFATGLVDPGRPRRALVSPGASIDPSADLIDAVVMEGASVGAGALVVRSVVCPGARVEPGGELVDAVMTENGKRSDKMYAGTAAARRGWR